MTVVKSKEKKSINIILVNKGRNRQQSNRHIRYIIAKQFEKE